VKSRHGVFAAAYLGMLLFGITLTTLGSVLPPLIERYGLDKSRAGALMALVSLGILAASLVFGPVVDRFGYRPVLLAGALGVGVGLGALALAPAAVWLGPAMLVFGFGGGLLNGATNALVADVSGERRGSGLAFLGIFFGIGACGVPILLGLMRRSTSYASTEILGWLAVLVLVSLLDFLIVAFPPPKQAQGFPLRRVGRLLGDGTLLLVGLLLFLQSGMEITLGGWSAAYAHDVLRLEEWESIFLLSLFWVGMMIARIVLSWLLQFQPAAKLFPFFLIVALAGAVLLLVVPDAVTVGAGMFLLGAGLASGFPILLGFLGEAYQDLTGTAFSAAFVMALLGGSTFPYLTGVLGDWQGLRASLLVIPAAVLGQDFLFSFLLRRRLGPDFSKTASSKTEGIL
jgi:FHS family glucose/mannose:H+ symporter-like MFS transporter